MNGQTLKTYSGDWDNPEGKITYFYTENKETGERIKTGSVTFDDHDPIFNLKIKGQYKNNFKDGIWVYTSIYKDYDEDDTGSKYVTGTLITTATYKKGIPNGVWTSVSNLKYRNRYYDARLRKTVWGNYGLPITESVKAYLENGQIINEVTFKTYDEISEKYTITTATIDTNGKLNGKFSEKTGDIELNMTFADNIAVKCYEKNYQTGKIENLNPETYGRYYEIFQHMNPIIKRLMFLYVHLPGDIRYVYEYRGPRGDNVYPWRYNEWIWKLSDTTLVHTKITE